MAHKNYKRRARHFKLSARESSSSNLIIWLYVLWCMHTYMHPCYARWLVFRICSSVNPCWRHSHEHICVASTSRETICGIYCNILLIISLRAKQYSHWDVSGYSVWKNMLGKNPFKEREIKKCLSEELQ